MRVTLREIAKVADLSVSTASRALNGHPAISFDTSNLVQDVAAKLHYKGVKSHKRMNRANPLFGRNIAVLTLGMHRTLSALPAVASAIHGVEDALTHAGASVQLAHVPDLQQIPLGLPLDRLDGVMLVGAMQGTLVADSRGPILAELKKLPTVWILGRPAGCWGDAVVANDYAVGGMAAEYLARKGHKLLAFVNPKPDHLFFMRREDGFLSAARRLGVEALSYCESPPEGWSLPLKPPLAVETVQTLVDRVLASTPRPTAIFAAADSIAAQVYRALSVRGLQVGRDMSVISANNDQALITALHPHLTTLDVHAHEAGRQAVRHMGMRLMSSSGKSTSDVELMVEPTLVEGESVEDLRTNASAK